MKIIEYWNNFINLGRMTGTGRYFDIFLSFAMRAYVLTGTRLLLMCNLPNNGLLSCKATLPPSLPVLFGTLYILYLIFSDQCYLWYVGGQSVFLTLFLRIFRFQKKMQKYVEIFPFDNFSKFAQSTLWFGKMHIALLHLPQGNTRELWCTHKITFQRRQVCR